MCSFEECDKTSYCKGFCRGHYSQQWSGKPLTKLKHRSTTIEHGTASCYSTGCRRDECKIAHGILARQWRKEHREQANQQSYRSKAVKKAWLDELQLASGCVDCGYNSHVEALHFDHLDSKTKEFTISANVSASWERLKAEVAKCEVRCANCHAIKTAERRKP